MQSEKPFTYRGHILIEYSPSEGVYIARVPALPGCTADGRTLEETAREITVAIEGHVQAKKALGMSVNVSTPSSIPPSPSERLPNPTPGEILKEIIEEIDVVETVLVQRTGIPALHLRNIIDGRDPITAEDSLRLGRFFGQSEPFWLNMQHSYDLRQARENKGSQIEKEVQPLIIKNAD